MEQFSREQNGYSTREVDITLARLKAEHQAQIKEKNSMISSLERKIHNLQDIVLDYVQREEKTQNIIESTQNLRSLEAQRLQLLYKKWTQTWQRLKDKVVPLVSYDEILDLTQDFQYALKVIVDSSTAEHQATKSYAKSVLSRMSGIMPAAPSFDKNLKNDYSAFNSRTIQNKKQASTSQKNETESVTPSEAEKFLNGQGGKIPKSMGMGKEIFSIPPREFMQAINKKTNGFSLEEALTPKESLAEIMTAFNLDD